MLKIARNILLVVVVCIAVLEFYIPFFHRGFHRASVILQVGLFLAFSMPTMAMLGHVILRKTGYLDRKPRLYLILVPPSLLVCGILAELFIFRLGGAHYLWLLGGLIISVVISWALDAHDRIKYLIGHSIGLLEKLYRQAILSLNKSLEAKEPYNKGHNERVAWYALQIAKKIDLEPGRSDRLVRAALLHDLGKIGISDRILLKTSELTEADWQAIRSHPGLSERILKPLSGFEREMAIIRCHHEHMDGSGYDRITGQDIPLESRIIAVADAFDAMTTSRPYRQARPIKDALAELKADRGRLFDADLVDAFTEYVVSQKNFERPNHIEIRSKLALKGWDQPAEENLDSGLLETIQGTTRRFSWLARFYRLLGLREKYLHRRMLFALGSGSMLGVFVGLAVFSTEKDPMLFLSFFLQGIVGGFIVLFLGASLESLVLRASQASIWRKAHGRLLIFFPAGLLAGLAALHLVHFQFSPQVPRTMDGWNLAYIVFAGSFAGLIAYLVDFQQKTSTLLLFSLNSLERLYFQLIYSLAFALEAKDPYSRGHSERVATYSHFLGERLGLELHDLEDLKLAALFHDIGKIGVRLQVLHKQSGLNEEEAVHLKKHPKLGADIIAYIGSFIRIAPFVRHHHEHWDGNGYPDGLRAEQIPLYSRIISVADALDALLTDRPYRRALAREQALATIEKESGVTFDPAIVTELIRAGDELDHLELAETMGFPEIAEDSGQAAPA